MLKEAVIGLDLGGTKLAAAVFDTEGRILMRTLSPLAGRTGRAVGDLARADLAALLQQASMKGLQIRAVGVSVPGISYSKTGKVWAPNIPGWDNFPLRSVLRTAAKGIPVKIDSDRACYILGEVWRGKAKGCQNAIFVAVGTGIGAGILVNGTVLRGAHDIAGAIGWLALDRPFRKEYIACGCFEHHASGEGLAKVANELRGAGKPPWSARDVFAKYPEGNKVAKATLAQAIEFWGMAVANLVSLFDPEMIVFGGGVFGPAARFLPEIKLEAQKWAQPISIKKVRLQPSKLGHEAGLYGAGHLAWQEEQLTRRR
jgi:glucokinase